MTSVRTRLRALAANATLGVAVFVLTFVVIEGASSVLLFTYHLTFNRNPGAASRQHATHDTLLGWVNTPGIVFPDMYGPGVALSINARSFRDTGETTGPVPAGQTRIVCSGDSFTLGIGVADDQTWCHLLETRLGPTVETVNLGHGGYGVDQMYLLYDRVSSWLEHDVHLFVFVPDDFRRMGLIRFVGYDKPVLVWQDGTIELDNVPVPRPRRLRHWAVVNQHILSLRVLTLGRGVLGRLGGEVGPSMSAGGTRRDLVLAIVDRIVARNRDRGSVPVFVLLPEGVVGPAAGERWAEFLTTALAERGAAFLDLMRPFQDLPLDERLGRFDSAWDHYNAEGNAWVAARIAEFLRGLPEVSVRLGNSAGARPGAAGLEVLR